MAWGVRNLISTQPPAARRAVREDLFGGIVDRQGIARTAPEGLEARLVRTCPPVQIPGVRGCVVHIDVASGAFEEQSAALHMRRPDRAGLQLRLEDACMHCILHDELDARPVHPTVPDTHILQNDFHVVRLVTRILINI